MNRRIIFALIAVIAIVFVCGTCLIVFKQQSISQCVVDPNYEANLSEEERAINELYNKLHYKRRAESLKEYEVYGMTCDPEDGQMYFNDVPVCYFEDNRSTDGTFQGTQVHCENGEIGIIAERDKTGALTGLRQLSGQELTDVLIKSWHK